MRTFFARYDVLQKWDTASFDAPTREALTKRLEPPGPPRFFSAAELELLSAVTERLIPQPDRACPIPLAAMIDAYLADGLDGGFRVEDAPPLRDAWRRGLACIEAEARRRLATSFVHATPALQEEVLRAVQAGEVDRGPWRGMDPAKFFTNTLLKLTAALYYAHPAAWSEIGFGGPASPRGYVRLGFDERDPWEAKEAGS